MGGRGHFSMASRSGPRSENNLVLKTHQSQLKGVGGGFDSKASVCPWAGQRPPRWRHLARPLSLEAFASA